ncbi:MAG: IS21 family transposase [Caloramator sp.]|nr:IS21 family transposase [Caloramator sp.]
MVNIIGQINIFKAMKIKPNFSELAREFGIDRRTVKKYYEGYEGKPKTRKKQSKLDKYYDEIKAKLQIKGVTVKGVYEYFVSKKYDMGTYSNFNKYVKRKGLKPNKKVSGHPRFETPEGKQAQVDWKENLKLISKHGEEFIVNVFNYKLGYSRYCHFEYRKTKTQQDVIECLISAFKATGGVPQEILFDNMKTIVDITSEGRKINNKLKAFADDFGFKIRLCKPRHSYTKGKVEAANKFIEWLLPYNNEFENEEELIKIIKEINKKVNQSINQSTGIQPMLLFQKEKEYLSPLPNNSIIENYMNFEQKATVHKDSMIYYKGNKYSVPAKYINKTVTLKVIENELHIYFNTELICVHSLSNKKLNYLDSHYRELMKNAIKNKEDIEDICSNNLYELDRLLQR